MRGLGRQEIVDFRDFRPVGRLPAGPGRQVGNALGFVWSVANLFSLFVTGDRC